MKCVFYCEINNNSYIYRYPRDYCFTNGGSMKTNCWETKKCGREPNGANAAELGICPAATEIRVHGVHDGKNGGRACWMVAGTFCGGRVQGTFAAKLTNCMSCDFYQQLVAEEGKQRRDTMEILAMLKQPV
jgi:hypothetical protein